MAVERLRRLLPALWAGVLLCIALIATPVPFALLDRADAGRVVGRIFVQEAWLSLVLAVGLLGDQITGTLVAGGGLVLTGVILTLFWSLARQVRRQEEYARAQAASNSSGFSCSARNLSASTSSGSPACPARARTANCASRPTMAGRE